MRFNTVYSELLCPHCRQKVLSGVGFRWGTLGNLRYKPGDLISWTCAPTRPAHQPDARVVKTVGYFNCDNIKCATWQDCYPQVQRALITIEDNVIADVSVFEGEASDNGF
ncbi:MAG: hypothetical protein ACRD3W_11725, partial [Terriglobales bacterium]